MIFLLEWLASRALDSIWKKCKASMRKGPVIISRSRYDDFLKAERDRDLAMKSLAAATATYREIDGTTKSLEVKK